MPDVLSSILVPPCSPQATDILERFFAALGYPNPSHTVFMADKLARSEAVHHSIRRSDKLEAIKLYEDTLCLT